MPVTWLLREAPEEGYQPDFAWAEHIFAGPEGTPLEDIRKERAKKFTEIADAGCYYLRLRTVLNDKGEVVSAKYGKMYRPGTISLVEASYYPSDEETGKPRPAILGLYYYFNPDGTRNLEYDTKRNLFKDLTYSQEPKIP